MAMWLTEFFYFLTRFFTVHTSNTGRSFCWNRNAW